MDPLSPIEKEIRVLTPHLKALHKLGIRTVEDMLYHFPVRYGDTAEIKNIQSLVPGEDAVVFGRINGLKTSKAFVKKTPMSDAHLEDETGRVKIVWFNQPYIAKMLTDGATVRVQGKVTLRKKDESLYFSNPKIEIANKIPTGVGSSLFGSDGDEHNLYPVYPESKGVTSNWMYHAVERIFKSGALDMLPDPLPQYLLDTYHLPDLKTAMIWIHAPKKEMDAMTARKRFAFQEIFTIHLRKEQEKLTWQKNQAFIVNTDKKKVTDFMKTFPFETTDAQKKAIDTVLSDFTRGFPMSRLLEGDVGSGKTAVAAATVFSVVTSRPNGKDFGNLQVAYMAPTEILAKQQFENFVTFFRGTGIQVGLITGSGCKKFPSKSDPSASTPISKPQLLKWIKNGEIPIVVGTHALVYKSVEFKHLAFAVIDEQHRFGTLQRQKLTTKNELAPHLLSMTATPIPRTLSLTLYGDLDLSVLDQMPVGRKPIITKVVLPIDRTQTYEEIKKELRAGRQLYVICPRIEEVDPTKENAVIAKSVTEEAKRLKAEVFQDWNIGTLHSKMTPADKEKVMDDFATHKTDILVATSVVEVGVNVPNATMIIIEGAERFGLSQLHQLRGRVIRSNHQAYCYVFTESTGEKTKDRMKALVTAKNGFELAEFDLTARGSGQLYGRKQWGVGDLAMEAIQNIKLVEASRTEARKLVADDPELKKYPLLKQIIESETDKIHFE
ncbi:MAG: ATP-dependent DNA helicase RecG [Candidatus Zambryskibacteria bacterium]|nr:ATP-dependent DNA helicase RecG [Candidatus Zambryskibacteria bacterium]